MKIIFLHEGQREPIEVGKELHRRGHEVEYINDKANPEICDILVINHTNPPQQFITYATTHNTLIVSLDGIHGLTISPFINHKAKHRGPDYSVVLPNLQWDRYKPYVKHSTVFVGIENKSTASTILNILDEWKVHALVRQYRDHETLCEQYKNITIVEENSFYDAVRECIMGVVDGGSSFFRSLYFGLPVVAIKNDERHKYGIDYLHHCCYPSDVSEEQIKTALHFVLRNEYYRENISRMARFYIDGKGAARIASLIEKEFGDEANCNQVKV